jgi:PPK2 family polyphosphate:nucleotide phosphotransferase
VCRLRRRRPPHIGHAARERARASVAVVRRDCRVEPGKPAELAKRSTDAKFDLVKRDAEVELVKLTERLAVLQNRLYAEHSRALLLVLQGLDASGKDGTIRRVFTGVNPQGCQVESFKEPSQFELDHDYLWRIHLALPRRGRIGIFNRSHYEDVTTTQVIGVIDDRERKRRYGQINDFERMLHEEGTRIVKVFLHVGKEEQRARLQRRVDDPERRWKFRKDDLHTRAKWDRYVRLYDAAITATSTEWAPWYIVPADHKWVSGLAVARFLLDELEDMAPQIPEPAEDLDGVVVE